MSRDEVEAIRKRAPSANSDAWREHFDEMAKKTAIRRLAKRIPQSAELADALHVEDEGAEPLPRGAVRIVEPETQAQLMPGREGRMDDRARTISSDEYGGAAEVALSPEAMLAADDPYAEEFQDDREFDDSGELPLGETRRTRNAVEEGR